MGKVDANLHFANLQTEEVKINDLINIYVITSPVTHSRDTLPKGEG